MIHIWLVFLTRLRECFSVGYGVPNSRILMMRPVLWTAKKCKSNNNKSKRGAICLDFDGHMGDSGGPIMCQRCSSCIGIEHFSYSEIYSIFYTKDDWRKLYFEIYYCSDPSVRAWYIAAVFEGQDFFIDLTQPHWQDFKLSNSPSKAPMCDQRLTCVRTCPAYQFNGWSFEKQTRTENGFPVFYSAHSGYYLHAFFSKTFTGWIVSQRLINILFTCINVFIL